MDVSVIGGADGPTAIFLAGKIGDYFWIPAVLILLIFYSIYFIKMAIQKRNGIQTNQMGKRKEKVLHKVEMYMKIATLFVVPVQLISVLFCISMLPNLCRVVGVVIALIGTCFFLIAVITMRDSWRAGIPDTDQTELVTDGIYRFSRNPAFFSFDLMYIGLLLMYFNIVLLLVTLWVIIMLHLQIKQEEKFLEDRFKEPYLEYKKHTNRYLGCHK